MNSDSTTPKNAYTIDVELVKKRYAENNPGLKPLTNADLAAMTGKNKQWFSDVQTTKKPKPDTPMVLKKLAEIGGLTIQELIKEVNEDVE